MLGDYEAEIYLKSISSIREPVFLLNAAGDIVYRSSGGAIYLEEIESALHAVNNNIAIARKEAKKFIELDVHQLGITSNTISNVFIHLIHPTFAAIILELSPTANFRSSNNPFRSDLNSVITTEVLKSTTLIDAGLNGSSNSPINLIKLKKDLKTVVDLLISLDQIGILYGSLFLSAPTLFNFYDVVESQVFFIKQMGLNQIDFRVDSQGKDVYIYGNESIVKRLLGDLLLQIARCNINFNYSAKTEKADGGVYLKIKKRTTSNRYETPLMGQAKKLHWLIAKEIVRGIQGTIAVYGDAGELSDDLFGLSRLEIYIPSRSDTINKYLPDCSECEAMIQADSITRELVNFLKPEKSLASISKEEFEFISNVISNETDGGTRK